MREDVSFDAEGVTLRGWLYRAEDARGRAPAVVMAHGFSAVKEMHLDRYAEVFARAGLTALVFDHRGFGASNGEPRQEIDPWQQVRDTRHAITWMRLRPDVDRGRIGVWGSSYSGGHAVVLGAIDRRVRCVVAQVPLVSGHRNLGRLIRADQVAAQRALLDADREARFQGKPPGTIAVVSNDPEVPAALPTADSWEWFDATARERAPAWRNQVTLRSVEMLAEYEPGSFVERVAPTPLLMIVGRTDHLTPADLALEAYARAREPKRLVLLPGGHFDAYGSDFEVAAAAARDWLLEHLG